MKGLWQKVKKSLGRRQKKSWLFGLAMLTVVLFVFLLTKPVGAELNPASIMDGILMTIGSFVLWLATFFMELAMFFLEFFITLASYNNYIDTPIVQLGWIMVRDVANMFFVVFLLLIALGTILGLEQYQWNKTLVKLILAAVFINFSNLICGIFIDIAYVFTATFVNAIRSTAGGNLINMLQLEYIVKMVRTDEASAASTGDEFRIETVGAIVVSSVFALMTMVVMGAYCVVMLFRVVVLWILVILSPLAFLLGATDKTKSYADEWWGEFMNHVIVAPVMVFFLWLTFATAGSGDMLHSMNIELGEDESIGATYSTKSEITQWNNMANFIIPLGLLLVGLERVSKLGVRGGELVDSAKGFMGDVVKIASGYALGRAVVGGAAGLAKGGLIGVGKQIAWKAPLIGGRTWGRRGVLISEAFKNNRFLRHLPFIGDGGEKHEKMDARVKKIAEMGKDRRLAQWSYRSDLMSMVSGGVFGIEGTAKIKGKEETRYQAALGQKEIKTAMKKDRNMASIMQAGRAHITKAENDMFGAWMKDQDIDPADLAEDQREQKRDEFRALMTSKTPEGGELREEMKKRIQESRTGGTEDMLARDAALMVMFKASDDTYAAQKELYNREAQLGYIQTGLGGLQFRDKVLAEKAAEGPKTLIDEIQNKHLDKSFADAADKMTKAMEEGMKGGSKDLEAAMRRAVNDDKTGFVRMMVAAEQMKLGQRDMEEKQRLASDAAADAVVNVPRYGHTTAATTLSGIEKEVEEWRGFDRARRAEDFVSTMAHYAQIMADGGELASDQKRHLFAGYIANQEEGWPDDIDANMLASFAELQDVQERRGRGELAEMSGGTAAEKKWTAMAKLFADFGKVELDPNTGNITSINQQYGRDIATLFQKIATTGMDRELIKADADISREVENRQSGVLEAVEEVKEKMAAQFLATAQSQPDYGQKLAAARQRAEQTMLNSVFDEGAERQKWEQEAKKRKMPKEQKQQFVDSSVENARQAAQARLSAPPMQDRINNQAEQVLRQEILSEHEEEMDSALKSAASSESAKRKADYWEVAKELMAKGATQERYGAIRSLQDLENRYRSHEEYLQEGTRLFKKQALDTGHIEYGYNMDYDDVRRVHRFQTTKEAEMKMYYERVKSQPGRMISSDQYHTFGTLNQKTGIVHDWIPQALTAGIGRVERAIEARGEAKRSKNSHFLLHKDEEGKTVQKDGKKYAVLGGATFRAQMAEEGETSKEDQLARMMVRDVASAIVSGNSKWYSLLAHSTYQHISEEESQRGIINLDVAGQKFDTIQQTAKFIADKLESGDAKFLAQLEKSKIWRGQRKTLISKLRAVETKEFKSANKGGKGGKKKGGSDDVNEADTIIEEGDETT